MGEFVNLLVEYIQNLTTLAGYPGVFLAAFLENFFPPIPSEVIFPSFGFSAGRGGLNIFGVIWWGTLGSLLGTVFWYALGYALGRANLKIYIERWGGFLRIKFQDVEKAEEWFTRYEGSAVFFGRLVPLVRTLISVPAGFVQMSFWRFIFLSFAGSFLWIGALSYGGFFLGEEWERVLVFIKGYEFLVFALLTVGVLLLLVRTLRGNKTS